MKIEDDRRVKAAMEWINMLPKKREGSTSIIIEISQEDLDKPTGKYEWKKTRYVLGERTSWGHEGESAIITPWGAAGTFYLGDTVDDVLNTLRAFGFGCSVGEVL